MDIIIGTMMGLVAVTVIVLIILGIEFLSQLYETTKENANGYIEDVKKEKRIHCPYCGSKDTSQTTRMIIIMQLPGRTVDCACFYCNGCSKRWFMEMDTLE